MMTQLRPSAMSTAGPTQHVPKKAKVEVFPGYPDDAEQAALGQALSIGLEHRGMKSTVEKLEAASEQSPITIVIDSVEHPLLLSPDSETF